MNNDDDISGSLWNYGSANSGCVLKRLIRLGKETVNGAEHDVFKGRMKLLAHLYAVGKDGIDVLKSLGFDLNDQLLRMSREGMSKL